MRETLARGRGMPGSEKDKVMFGIGGTELLVILLGVSVIGSPFCSAAF